MTDGVYACFCEVDHDCAPVSQWCVPCQDRFRSMGLAAIQMLVEQQAEDEGLWFIAQTAAEAYLQQELRALHAAIEAIR